MFQFLPNSILQMMTVFLSIIIEAFPFVVLGCVLSGFIQIFLTPEVVKKILPKNKFLSICFGIILGFFFPSCECGIVPIVNQLIRKKVPTATAICFMLTAPIVNPIVIFSTYIAFGNNLRYAFLRIAGGIFVALIVGLWLTYFMKDEVLKAKVIDIRYSKQQEKKGGTSLLDQLHAGKGKISVGPVVNLEESLTLRRKIYYALQHSIEEVFDTGQYLIVGALIASCMQTYIPTAILLKFASTKLLSILMMIVLALVMSLCSEADAFIGASFLNVFGTAPVMAFLIFGPMVDIKNLLMMQRFFTKKFIVSLTAIVTVSTIIFTIFI